LHDWNKMNKFKILIPVFNDWVSLEKLLQEININIKNIKNVEFECIIINDASTEKTPIINLPSNIKSIKLINMKKNKGHARCNAFGIRYLAKHDQDYDHVVLMDGDGEDRPQEIKNLVEKAIYCNTSIVGKRIKRSEGVIFQLLYNLHKILTLISTGKNINFGNYSCLKKDDIKTLSTKKSLWSSFSGSLKKHILNLDSIDSIRGLRYFGPSQMSLYKLCIHSFSIIAVFKYEVFMRSVILLIITSYFNTNTSLSISFFQLLLVFFNLVIYLVSRRENSEEFLNSDLNQESLKTYTH